jgi:hypothetical protein
MATSRPTTAGQPYRFLQQSKINIQHSTIINSSTYHADGDKSADHGGSALPSFLLFKIFILLSRPFA